MASAGDECPLCRALRSDRDAWANGDEYWAVGVLPGFEVPGWMAIVSRQHVAAYDHLDLRQTQSFGPVLATVTAALRSVTGAEKVYLSALGERYEHWHALVVPRRADVPPEGRGLALLASGPTARDVPAAARAFSTLRQRLAMDDGGEFSHR